MATQPQIFSNLQDWIKLRRELQSHTTFGSTKKSIGFVPTMGALHDGHRSLLIRSRSENDVSVLSIYLNPTQFDNKEDLKNYPKSFEADYQVACLADVDFILMPTFNEIYPDDYKYKIVESDFSQKLCGAHRPGHFEGMLTVVMKLLNIANADRAYFGEKDYQQLQLIRGMANAFFMPTEIVGCSTVREADGLAMSSRNKNLSPQSRNLAAHLHRTIISCATTDEARANLLDEGFEIDYIEDLHERRFAAVKIDGVRLIDNVKR